MEKTKRQNLQRKKSLKRKKRKPVFIIYLFLFLKLKKDEADKKPEIVAKDEQEAKVSIKEEEKKFAIFLI